MPDACRPLLHSSFIRHVELHAYDRVLEYGCGASTVWLAGVADRVVAIEHDPVWADWVQRFRCGALVLTLPRPYARWGVGMGPFDMCVVDGRGRPECLAAGREVADFVVLDDAQRHWYAKALIEMDNWGDRIEFTFDAALDPPEREGVQLLGWTVRE